jgi:hypothetical protein
MKKKVVCRVVSHQGRMSAFGFLGFVWIKMDVVFSGKRSCYGIFS